MGGIWWDINSRGLEKVLIIDKDCLIVEYFEASIREVSGLRSTADFSVVQFSRLSSQPKRRPKTPTKGAVVVEYRKSSQNGEAI